MLFKDRLHAGQLLAPLLEKYKHSNAIVLGLARGGVITAEAIANYLQLQLDVLCPRKIGAPFNPEFAIGAVSDQGEPLLNKDIITYLNISQQYIDETVAKERKNAQMRLKKFHYLRTKLKLEDSIVILVDDGLATGATMLAAIKGMRSEKVGKIIVAVPVSPSDTLAEIGREVDEIVCLYVPEKFEAVGQFYENFSQIEDEEVVALLKQQT